MKNNQEEQDALLKKTLHEFEISVPDFSVKKSRASRIANWFFAPVMIPFFEKDISFKTFKLVQVIPIIMVVLMTIPFLFIKGF
ncbi:hypothetical protein ACQKP0_19135 [Heyndrickxia sp. NPDC080065]|uniref:hypothetical protein n=1 Tax=Heyndrickxia sp. NPDC080065 TaxID=3390568 RepID=UPI003CFF1B6B